MKRETGNRLLSKRVSCLLIGALALLPVASTAQVVKQTRDELSALTFKSPTLQHDQALDLLDNVRAQVGTETSKQWEQFHAGQSVDWQATVDRRTGLINFAEGGNLAWIPGHGNNMATEEIAEALAGKPAVDLAVMETIARNFLTKVSPMLGVDPSTLVLNRARSGQPATYVWFVDFDVYSNGMPIEGARVVFRVNNGNLVQFGSEHLPSLGAKAPAPTVSQAAALAAAERYFGGLSSTDTIKDPGSLHVVPALASGRTDLTAFEFGKGRGLSTVWQFVFHRDGVMGNWRARVDATTGAVVEFIDINQYATAAATGGTYLDSASDGSEVVRPMPYTNLSTGGFANSAGLYSYTSGTLTSALNGQYVKITDTCGAISLTADASGNLAFGTSTGTDCTTPGKGGAGNTHASREQFYQVNRIKEVGRSWLPSNTWLTQQLLVIVNLNQTCNAYWDGTKLNFFHSGGGCANTGELAGVSLHEYGHGLDSNDGNGDPPDNGTGEATGDFTAALALHESCIGPGFLSANCSGYGNACTSCTGVRDLDYAKHSSPTAATVSNYTRVDCPTDASYAGPCGKEGHCESAVASQALWDLPNRDLPNPGTGAAWTTVDRLWFLSRATSSAFFTCTATGNYTSNGCNAGSIWKVFRVIDDDDGNLTNGTPHGGAIYAALNRHLIACTTDPGATTTFAGCTPPATPTLTVTPGSNSASASWTASGSSVYDLYRNERGCNAGFTKIASATSSTTFADSNVANGMTYYYQVAAFPSGNEACASAPSTCITVTPSGGTCTPPAAPTGVTATAASSTQINVSWTASAGATSYTILRATTSGGPYTSVGTSTTTSFSNTGLSCGTTYYYVVQASNGTCASGNSTQASATTPTCTCTPPAAPTGVTASATGKTTATVSWTASSGATSYNILRSTTSGGPYTQVGTSSTTSFSDTGLTCATTYYYVVQASNGTCASGNSTQSSTTTSTCGGTCTPTTLYSNTFETGTGLTDWTTGTFVSGGSTVDWRGIQACTAHDGTKIFRFGGTSCTADYANNRFSFSQPKGATGIAVGAAATGTTLSFWHHYGFESGFDGGTLAVSVDGSNYTFVPATALTSGSKYNGTISNACPPTGAAGAAVFTGSQSAFVNTTVNLDAACNAATGLTTGCAGHNVYIAFTTITDCSTVSTGWFLDTVQVTDCQ